MDIQTISELVENQAIFASTGYSVVKITIGGKAMARRLPIKSTGVAEYQQKLSSQAPRPPAVERMIKADSDLGKALGLSRDEARMVFDATDEKFVNAQDEHNRDFAWRVAVFALDIKWTRSDGSEARTYEEKRDILKRAGITGHQIDCIYRDIQKLTKFTEEEIDFLSESCSDTMIE